MRRTGSTFAKRSRALGVAIVIATSTLLSLGGQSAASAQPSVQNLPTVAQAAAGRSTTVLLVKQSAATRTFNNPKATTFTFTVKAANGTAANGKVAIKSNGAIVDWVKVVGGKATWTVPRQAAAGSRVFYGMYTGTAAYKPSNSARINLLIKPLAAKVTTSVKPAVVNYGSSTVLRVSVTASGYVPTGKVELRNTAGQVIKRAILSRGSASFATSSRQLPGVAYLEAVYTGDKGTTPASSKTRYWTNKVNPTVSLVLSRTSGYSDTKIGAVVKVNGTVGTATGSVQINVSGTVFGPKKLVGGTATIYLPTGLSLGTKTVTAQYLGSTLYNGAGSAARTVKIVSKPVPASPCPATADACVDLTNETTWLQSGGKIVYGPVPMTAGRAGHRTNVGTHYVFWKDKDHLSSEFNNAPMPNSVFFDGGIAFHEGSLYVQSHGCIHLSWDASEYFYNFLSVGDQVVVFGTDPY